MFQLFWPADVPVKLVLMNWTLVLYSARSWPRARWIRLFTVPSASPVTEAISS